MRRLSDLPNIGRVIEEKLMEVGIDSPEKLVEIGSKESFIRIKAIDSSACLHMLYGLEGAVQGIKDKFLSEEVKEDLKKFYKSF